MSDHAPPNDQGAEKIALGACMISDDALVEISDVLKPGDFYQNKHGQIYAAIMQQVAKGFPTDPEAIAAFLIDSGDILRIGGAPYLVELVESVPTAANGAYYARRVATLARRRNVTAALAAGMRAVADPQVDLDTAIDRAGQEFYDAAAAGGQTGPQLISQNLAEVVESIAAGRDNAVNGLATGFRDLDRLTGGLRPGQLIVVAGRPGMGKSVFVADVIRRAGLQDGKTVLFFSLEMTQQEITVRMLSAESKVPLSTLQGQTRDGDLGRLAPHIEALADARIHIDESAALTLTEIRTRARRIAQRGDLDLIVVDYLQLARAGRRAESREQEVAEVARGLKGLAKDIGVPVIAAAQLNRGLEQRADKRPQLADLRESGEIEQTADIVILLHRDDYYDKESARAGEADFIVAKHRGGPTDTITVAAQLHLSRFADMAAV